jgi:hypothetical protein
MSAVLAGLDVAGSADAWRAAGFAVEGEVFRVGAVAVRCGIGERGIDAWSFAGIPSVADVDGLPTRVASGSEEKVEHPNRAVLIDHVVVWSPDGARTTRALQAIGLEVRRVRDDARPGVVQSFFRAGEVVIELVAPPDPEPDGGPARFFGIAVTVADLDECAAQLGDALGRVKDAVQPGRRIATLRHRDIGVPVAVAYMSA